MKLTRDPNSASGYLRALLEVEWMQTPRRRGYWRSGGNDPLTLEKHGSRSFDTRIGTCTARRRSAEKSQGLELRISEILLPGY